MRVRSLHVVAHIQDLFFYKRIFVGYRVVLLMVLNDEHHLPLLAGYFLLVGFDCKYNRQLSRFVHFYKNKDTSKGLNP